MIESDKILLLISSTLVLNYVAGLIYSKTKIPDIIWIIGFGILLGPVFGLFDKNLFLSLSPLMSTVALSIILFDAGINLNIHQLMQVITKATVLSITTIFSVIITLGYSLNFFLPSIFSIQQGMLLGAMIGGTSTVAIYGIMGGIERLTSDIESSRNILLIESVVSDPICIISSITLLKMIMSPGVLIIDSVRDLLTSFILASLVGLSIGMMWAEALDRLKGRSLNYILTIAILFPTYLVAEYVVGEGAGPISALSFGFMITNYNFITGLFGVKRDTKIDITRLREFHEEITYFIKSFFFVYVGLIVTLSLDYLQYGLGVLSLIFFVRFVVVRILGYVMTFSEQEILLSSFIYASGLPAFVLSQLPIIYDPSRQFFENPEMYPNIVMPVVLGTVLFAAIATPIVLSRSIKQNPVRKVPQSGSVGKNFKRTRRVR